MNNAVQHGTPPPAGNRSESPTGEEEIEFRIIGRDENGDLVDFSTDAVSHADALLAYRCFHFPAPGKRRKPTLIHEEHYADSRHWNLVVLGGGVKRYYEVR